MQKTDVTELRKHLKKAPNEPGIIDWVYGVYVSPENEAVCETILSYDTMEDEDRFRYAGILNKAIPANVGAALIPIGVAQNNELADCANNGGADDIPEVLSELRDRLMEEYVHTDPYYAVAMRILYDVPARSSDGAYLEDGNALYSAIVFAVCPAKLSTPALGLENGQVENLTRRWTVGAPAFGFLYPSFSDRDTDRNEAALYIKKEEGKDFLGSYFKPEKDIPSQEEEKEKWAQILSESNVSTQAACLINEALCETEEEYIDRKTLEKIAEEAGADSGKIREAYDKYAGEDGIPAAIVSEKSVDIRTGNASIKVPAGSTDMIRTETIDGIEYILVPVNGVVSVNGTEVSIS